MTGWLTILSSASQTNWTNFSVKTGHSQNITVRTNWCCAILKGLRTQLQVDGKMEVCSVGPHFTGHDDETIDEEDIAKFHDDVTGKMLPGHLVRAARQEEIKFLNTFPVYKKVPEANANAQGTRHRSRGVTSTKVTVTTWLSDHGFGGRIRSCRARSRPLHPWKASSKSFTGFRPVDDDIGENWK